MNFCLKKSINNDSMRNCDSENIPIWNIISLDSLFFVFTIPAPILSFYLQFPLFFVHSDICNPEPPIVVTVVSNLLKSLHKLWNA